MTTDDAYSEAGYTPNRGNAARLKSNEAIAARIAELQAETAQTTRITAASITERLIRIADIAEEHGIARNVAGVIIGVDRGLLAVARQAAMDAAKLNGLIVDKHKIDATVYTPRKRSSFYDDEGEE